MVHDSTELSDRDFEFLRDQLTYLNEEVTRYRDIEWKATSFHAAVLIALAFLLLDDGKRSILIQCRPVLIVVIFVYGFLAVYQLVFIHSRLNSRRNDRADVLKSLGAEAPPRITRFSGLYEGKGFLFIATFILYLIFLVAALIALLL